MITHKGTQTIETRRLLLRRGIREDAEPMFRNWASDSEVYQRIKYRNPNNLGVDNEYLGVYNRIKHKEGELTMYCYCFNAVDNKSGNGMLNATIGLALSYSFLR